MSHAMVNVWNVRNGVALDETMLARLYKRNIPYKLGPSTVPNAGGFCFSGVYVREDFKRAALRFLMRVYGRRAECEVCDVNETENV